MKVGSYASIWPGCFSPAKIWQCQYNCCIPLAFAFALPVMFPSLIQSPTSTSTGSFSWFEASNVIALRRSVVEPEHPTRRVSLCVTS
jgi:hypothetical protein